jgi:hypothetical protein
MEQPRKLLNKTLRALYVSFISCPSNCHGGLMGKSNAQTLFGIHAIPTDNHIRKMLDVVPPQQVYPMFHKMVIINKTVKQPLLNAGLSNMPNITERTRSHC